MQQDLLGLASPPSVTGGRAMPTVSLQHNTKAVRAGSKNVALALRGREDRTLLLQASSGAGTAGGGKD
ncbi:hypothetical protein E2C01_003116 [Portunus trituberculatus]|uniref:Uncharacterized protein n=1 Tax=Portunus trituberculatus TaxID=210409 RepID=A0A5B7CLQ2_PORTR|nr:hypothetical protein [Portunus trituberculatus]